MNKKIAEEEKETRNKRLDERSVSSFSKLLDWHFRRKLLSLLARFRKAKLCFFFLQFLLFFNSTVTFLFFVQNSTLVLLIWRYCWVLLYGRPAIRFNGVACRVVNGEQRANPRASRGLEVRREILRVSSYVQPEIRELSVGERKKKRGKEISQFAPIKFHGRNTSGLRKKKING